MSARTGEEEWRRPMLVSEFEVEAAKESSTLFAKLRVAAAIGCVLVGTVPSYAQVQASPAQAVPAPAAAQGLPPEPAPNYTQPLYLRDTNRDFSKPRGYWPNPAAPYSPTSVQPPNFANSVQLDDLVKGGKIYLSLGDAVLLALQNNYDIAIQRLNLDLADVDLMRSKSGALINGVNTSLQTSTQGGTTASVSAVGGGPGGASAGASVSGTGVGGLALTTSGAGPTPENLDPALTGLAELNHVVTPSSNPLFSGGLLSTNTNTNTYNLTFNQGFITGTALQVGWQNTRTTTNNPFQIYSPNLSTSFNAQITQHLLYGFGWGVNGRFIVQAKNDRRIADSIFRMQLLYTITQVENIYWGLVSSYEDVQSKQHALDQSMALERDDEKQLQVGSMAPLDVVNAKSAASGDQQALVSAQNTLEYQQLTMKQAIARNLDDPALANAPIVPTDRVSLAEMPEEHMSTDDLVREADANSPAVEQDLMTLKNDEISLKGAKNALLPQLDLVGFYGASAQGGPVSPDCNNQLLEAYGITGGCKSIAPIPYSTVYGNLFNSTGPNKGVEFTLNLPLRNRAAQATQAQSQIEYRQEQMRLQQAYIQIRMNVISLQYALTNDRAAVTSAIANQDFNQQSLDAEIKKLHLGASTTALVLQQQRSLAGSDAQLIAARARFAYDRSALEQTLASTLDRYGINIVDAATGNVHAAPVIPGIEPAKAGPEVTEPTQKEQLQKQEQQQQQPTQPQPQPQPQPQN